MAKIQQWECTRGHMWFMLYDHEPAVCPVCLAPNTEMQQKLEWKKHPLYRWAKRKTVNR